MKTLRAVSFAALALAAGELGVAVAGGGAEAPQLHLRATPSVALPPVDVLAVGRLVGGEEQERFYCPAVEWSWGDGSRSARQSDCPPFGEDARLDRVFSAAHRYRDPGAYRVSLTLRRGDRRVAVATAVVVVHGPDLATDGR